MIMEGSVKPESTIKLQKKHAKIMQDAGKKLIQKIQLV